MTRSTAGPADLSPEAWQFLEARVAAFENAWKAGKYPAIETFCPKEPADDPSEGWLLPELVHADLEFRIQAGQHARVEQYLARYPALERQAEIVADLLETEFRVRHACDPHLIAEEYQRRFPQHVPRLIEREVSSSTTRVDDAAATIARPPRRPTIPGFEIGKLLGRGGMGVVYAARDQRLNRSVAVKVLHGGSDARDQLRLRREAEAAAALQHRHVVQLHQIGMFDDGCFIVMELLPGGSLAERIKGTPLPEREAAALLEPIACAVAFAHAQGLIHRDLKPANVLFAADGTAKVADFGLAKRLDDNEVLTQTGATAGSPSYMAPEQALGSKNVGPAADIWALGAILYEMLTGRPPFRGATSLDTLELVRRSDPVPPRRLVPRLSKDLETICLKCLEKEPSKRYTTAEAIAEDLTRFRRGEAILARPVSSIERVRRWVLKNRTIAALLALLTLSLAGGTSASVWYAAVANAHAAQSAEHLQASKRSEAEATRLAKESQKLAAEAREQERQTRKLYFAADTRRATDALNAVNPQEAAELVHAHRGDSEAHPFVLNFLDRLARSPSREVFRDDARLYVVSLSPDRQIAATCGAAGEICFFDANTWLPVGIIDAGQGELNGLAWSADGQRLASAGDDGTLVMWDLATRSRLWTSQVFERLAFEVAFGLNDRLLAVCGHDPQIRLLDPATGAIVGSLDGHRSEVESIAVTPDGRVLLSAGEDNFARAWDLEQRKILWSGDGGKMSAPLKDVAVSADGQWAAFGSSNSKIWIKEISTGARLYHGPLAHGAPTVRGASLRAVSFVGDSHDLLIAADGKCLELVRIVDGQLVPIPGSARPAWAVPRQRIRSVIANGDVALSASDDGVVDLWEYSKAPAWRSHDLRDVVAMNWFTRSNGEESLTVGSASGHHVVNPDTGHAVQRERSSTGAVVTTSDGSRAFTLTAKGTLRCWDLSGPSADKLWERHRSTFLKEYFAIGPKSDATRVESRLIAPALPGAPLIALISKAAPQTPDSVEPCVLTAIDAATGSTLLNRHFDVDVRMNLAATPDGTTLAITPIHAQGIIQTLDASTFKERKPFVAHPTSVYSVAFNPRGDVLASSGDDLKIKLWRDGQLLRAWQAGSSQVHGLSFSPDGRLLLSVTRDQPPRVWDADSGRLLLDCARLLPNSISKTKWWPAAFSPSGTRIAVGGGESLIILDGRPLEE